MIIILTHFFFLYQKKDCDELKHYDKSRAEQLHYEIINFQEKRLKDDRKLAKEIAKWIDQAMTTNNTNSPDDISLPVDDDSDSR